MNCKSTIRSAAFKDFGIAFLVLGTATALFHLFDLDIAIQSLFYSPAEGWRLEHRTFWDFTYRYGIFPGYLFAVGCLAMISVSYWNERYFKYRKAAVVMVVALILGPGLLVNAVFKDHWQRPRPREVTQFGGGEQFVPVCVRGHVTGGKSFPCGHASMGFYLAVPYLFLRRTRKGLAYAFLALGIGYGSVIGAARMIAGGHFLSDVIWAAGMVWIAALASYYAFRFDEAPATAPADPALNRRKARMATIAVAVLLPVITVGLVLATPYRSQKSLTVSSDEFNRTSVVKADLKAATVDITNDAGLKVNYLVNAFGFPNSKVRGTWTQAGGVGAYTIEYMGWFTEVRNTIALKLPMRQKRLYLITVGDGRINCSIDEKASADFRLSVAKGDINLKGNNIALVGDASKIINHEGKKLNAFPVKPQNWSGTVVEFEVKDGKLLVE
jgi:membrane-associated PAP2 superfamily phosphatase